MGIAYGEQEMHQDQLNTVAELSSIILGFMMISFLQFTFDTTETAPHLQIFFSVSAALTVRHPLDPLEQPLDASQHPA